MKIKQVFAIFGVCATADLILRLFYLVVQYYIRQSDRAIWPIFSELLKPSNKILPDLPFGGYIVLMLILPFIFLIFLAFKSIISYFSRSFMPISVLETHLTLNFIDQKMVKSRLGRRQVYYANRDGQSAYHMKSSVNNPGAVLEKSEIILRSRIDEDFISTHEKPLVFGTDRSCEIIERYKQDLPTNFIASILPDTTLHYLFNRDWFKKYIAVREGYTVSINDYNGDEAQLSLTSLRYPVSNVTISVVFPAHLAPEESEIQAWLIRENAAKEIKPNRTELGGEVVYTVSRKKFFQSTLRLFWYNKKLRSYRDVLDLEHQSDVQDNVISINA